MNETILLVDDDPNILLGLSRALRKQRYHIFTARGPEECVDILKRHPIDLVVTDEMMEGMRGTDFLHWIRHALGDVPRILLTGHLTAAVRERAIDECSAYAVFSKPCDGDELSATIRAALAERELIKSSTSEHRGI
jgi:DNA-binding NtrC family response regulator